LVCPSSFASSSTQHSWLTSAAANSAPASSRYDLADVLVELDQLEVAILALSVSRIIKFVSAHMRASRRSGDGSPLQRLLGHELVVEFRKWREMSGKRKKLRRLGARPTLTASRPSEEFPGVLSASELDSSTSICLAASKG
jgi:hypothetical protein